MLQKNYTNFQSILHIHLLNFFRSHKKSGADTLPLFKYNHIAEAFGSKKPDYLHYNPTVPLPAYYQPPLEDGASTSDLYYEMMPPIEKPPQLYPLIILQTQRDYQQQKPLTHYEFNAFPPQNNPRGLATSEAASSQPCCDYRACKIGFCLSLFVLAIFGSFLAYMLYKKYIK